MNSLIHDNIRVLILSGGKISPELRGIFGNIPSGLVPINGEPVIFKIIDKLLNEKFSKITVAVGYKKKNLIRILEQHYKNKIKLNFVYVDHTKAPGNSIISSLTNIDEEKLLVILGDTLSDDSFSNLVNHKKDLVLMSNNFVNSEKWCIVEEKEEMINSIYDKKCGITKKENFFALIGMYFFSDVQFLKEIISEIEVNNKIEISFLLSTYKKYRPIYTIESKQWFDVGHKNNYYASKKKLFQSRYFNYLEFDESIGIVTKRSDNKTKLISEINWYHNIPTELKPLVPKLIDYNTDNPYLILQHITDPTLSELWLYGDIGYEKWKSVIDQLIDVVSLFRKYPNFVTEQDYRLMYIQKTEQRIDTLISSSESFRKLLQNDIVVVNNIKLKNWYELKERIYSKTKELLNEDDNCLLHGDLCFSNIFYDLDHNSCKIIDPRGFWGSTMYGDIKYDVAKLRHSIVGGYDSIVNGLFNIELHDNNIRIDVFQPLNYNKIQRYFDNCISDKWKMNQVKMIEGLLFISMLPLHGDYFEKQLAFYTIGIQRLNEVIDLV